MRIFENLVTCRLYLRGHCLEKTFHLLLDFLGQQNSNLYLIKIVINHYCDIYHFINQFISRLIIFKKKTDIKIIN